MQRCIAVFIYGYELATRIEHFDLPAASTFEMTLTSGEFDSSLFELANGADFEASTTHQTPHVLVDFVSANGTINLPSVGKTAQGGNVYPEADDIHINGMTVVLATTELAVPKTDDVVVLGKDTNGKSTGVLNFLRTSSSSGASVVGYEGAEFEITYFSHDEDAVTLKVTNDRSAIAEATLVWPVYNGGETSDDKQNFMGSNILGYVVLNAPKVRVTAVPGFDTSYKSAATNAITLATMEPENDKPAYTITFSKKSLA